MRILFLFPLLLLSSCATVMSGIESMTEKMEAQNAARNADRLTAFPDPALRAAYVAPDGRPLSTFTCIGCSIDAKGPDDRLDFIRIERDLPKVADARDLGIRNANNPLETQDVGRIFIRNAQARGNQVAVYGPAVNHQILQIAQLKHLHIEERTYRTNLSSCLVELDAQGAFVSILVAKHELNQGFNESDIERIKDVFVVERLWLLPVTSARFVQERMPVQFTEAYRIR